MSVETKSSEGRRMRVDVAIVGGGPGGIAAAVEAGRAGRRVVLVSDGPVGGRAMHASLLPSKVLLHLAEERATRGDRGLASAAAISEMTQAIERLVAHQRARVEERLSDAGVTVIVGSARFTGPRELHVAREAGPLTLELGRAIVASGSVPTFPAGFFGDASGPDGEVIFAPRFVRSLRSLPETLLVIGGGATGAEATSAFTDLGVKVTWIVDDLGLLPRFDRELASSLGDVLMERGVKIVHGKSVTSVTRDPRPDVPREQRVLAKLEGGRSYGAERAFVAIGRVPDVARLSLEAAGVTMDPRTGAIVVDADGRTQSPDVFAVGDAAGAPFAANKAMAEGWRAARLATDRDAGPPLRGAWIETVYSRPEVARVGVTPEQATRRGRPFEVRVASYESSLRGVLAGAGRDPHARGTLKVVLDADERIEGAIAIGPQASEVLAPIATALHLRARADALRGLFLAEPSLTSIALEALR
ncbi:MAG: NAD(P)/FAD-dependent oxidoreductase [Sandaracinaceae bacterium]|nr:NAD(P)/FAD-dependent oxidoreductase [Sandaracinaceae bacterium]